MKICKAFRRAFSFYGYGSAVVFELDVFCVGYAVDSVYKAFESVIVKNKVMRSCKVDRKRFHSEGVSDRAVAVIHGAFYVYFT